MKDELFDDRTIFYIELELKNQQYIDLRLENEPFKNWQFYREILSKRVREIYGEGRERREIWQEKTEYTNQYGGIFTELPAIPYTERQLLLRSENTDEKDEEEKEVNYEMSTKPMEISNTERKLL